MKPVGYLLNKSDGIEGEAGIFYDYILAENGIFIRARNTLLSATLCISPVQIRGVKSLLEEIDLIHGKVPWHIYRLAVSTLVATRSHEQYLAVTWDGHYSLQIPEQTGEAASVSYERLPSTILDIHSHGTMPAFFSGTDNSDEQGLRLYMVMGKLNDLIPDVDARIGVYGYFAPLKVSDIFDV